MVREEPLFLPPHLTVDIVARLCGVYSLAPFLLSLPRGHPCGQRQHCQQGVIPSPKPGHQPAGVRPGGVLKASPGLTVPLSCLHVPGAGHVHQGRALDPDHTLPACAICGPGDRDPLELPGKSAWNQAPRDDVDAAPVG